MTPASSRTITRNRERLACKECRRRKLKCDRSSPCGSCVRRGDGASCTYQRLAQAAEERLEHLMETQARLEHLEELVQQLASQPTIPSSNSISLTPPLQTSEQPLDLGEHGVTRRYAGTLTYNGATHWSAMLEDINQLKLAMPMEEIGILDDIDSDRHSESAGVELLFGGATPLPLEIILNTYLPPRQEVDRMTSAYFRAEAVAAPFIHASHFRRLYQEFWENPDQASPLWISILFSICHISATILRQQNRVQYTPNQFLIAAAHCLCIGKYFRPGRFVVEALTLFSQAQCLTSSELPTDIGALSGLTIRLALKMGYHRDPEKFQLSVFEKEMRRRTWSFCMQLDIIISFHLGLPTTVQYPTWDTKAPSVLLDSDFDEDSVQLPPSRPDAELNHMSFYLAKHKFMAAFERILRHTLSTEPDGSKVEELDRDIRAVFNGLPEPLKPRPMSESIVDSAHVMVTRLCVSFVYCKCLCVLHRPYVRRNRSESIAICYETASRLVGEFIDAYYEFMPGGQAETESWFLSAISWHDFLFGIMALSLVLCTATSGVLHPTIDVNASIDLLGKARNLCNEQVSSRHKDTTRVMAFVNAAIAYFNPRASSSHNISLSAPSELALPSANEGSPSFQANMSWDPTWNVGNAMTGIGQDPAWEYLEEFFNFNVET